MKKKAFLWVMALAVGMTACKNDELLRVEKVIGVYDYTARTEVYDLVLQGAPVVSDDSSTLYVTRPLEDEDGFIGLLDDEVYLDKDLKFSKSEVNYTLSGEFDKANGLVIARDVVDTDAKTRTKTSYTCTRQ